MQPGYNQVVQVRSLVVLYRDRQLGLADLLDDEWQLLQLSLEAEREIRAKHEAHLKRIKALDDGGSGGRKNKGR